MRKRELLLRLGRAEQAKADLVEAIRLTQEYVQLPAAEGWTWYEALRRHAPAVAEQLKTAAAPRQPLS